MEEARGGSAPRAEEGGAGAWHGGGGAVGSQRRVMRHRWARPGREGCWAKRLFWAKMKKKENGLQNKNLNLFKD
jgi:hypothetical protein